MKGGLARFVAETNGFVRYAAEPGRAGALGKGMIRALGGDCRGAAVGRDGRRPRPLAAGDASRSSRFATTPRGRSA